MNWNEMSDSEEDSWFDDDPPKAEGETTEQTQTKPKQQKKQSGEKNDQAPKQSESTKPAETKRKFLTDEELLNLYISKNVDDPKAIKVVRCQNEDAKQVIKQLKTAKVVSINDTTYLLFFHTEQDLIQFFKEKIANRYRFYFHKFEKRVREDDKNRQPRNKRQYRQNRDHRENRDHRQHREPKQRRQNRDHREQRPNRRKQGKRYEQSSDSEQFERKKKSPKEEKKNTQTREQKAKKSFVQRQAFTIPDNSNKIEIISNGFEINRVLNEITKKKITNSFNKIYIKAPINTFERVSTLCKELSKSKYYLEKVPQTEGQPDTVVELILVENGKNQTMKFYEKYHEVVEEKSNSKNKKYIAAQTTEEKVKQICRSLGSTFSQYFKDIAKCNLSEIVEGFDQHEYINRFRQASQTIQKHWNSWNIQAQEDNIEMLLKLTNRIKKSTLYDIELRPSLRAEKAVLRAQLRERPEKERRPKVDVANVNIYLS